MTVSPGFRRYLFSATTSGDAPRRAPEAILSERSAGDMAYRRGQPNAARERFFGAIGMPPGGVLAVELKHTRSVILYDGSRPFPELAEEAAAHGGADGIISTRDDVAVSVTVADCMPIFLYDRVSGAIKHDFNGFLAHNSVDEFSGAVVRALSDRALLELNGRNAQATLCRSWEEVVHDVAGRYAAILSRWSH